MSGSKNKDGAYRERKRIERHRYYSRTANKYPPHLWTDEEEKMVMEHTVPDSELSDKLGRSVKSIQEKRRRIRRYAEAGKPLHQKPRTTQQLDEKFYEAAKLWKEGKIPALEGARRCGMPNSSFRSRANRLYAEKEKPE
ncbi:MAG: hypothetical protein LUC92_00435 [Clostridiales bacterium]|nr:hypothetical protein [Clostridiales bacterium]